MYIFSDFALWAHFSITEPSILEGRPAPLGIMSWTQFKRETEILTSILDGHGPGPTPLETRKSRWTFCLTYHPRSKVYFNWREALQARSISRDIWNLPPRDESVLAGSRGICLKMASTLTAVENLLWQTGGIAQKKKAGFLPPGISARYHST